MLDAVSKPDETIVEAGTWTYESLELTEAKQHTHRVHLPRAIDKGHNRATELHHERVTLVLVLLELILYIRRIFAALYTSCALPFDLSRV